jgi:outer membrane protein OmpA-like peptidoglycan-associated protein
MVRNLLLFASALSLLAIPAMGGDHYPDPDSPQVAAAARKALANAKVLDIVGIALGIDADLKDLGAKVTETEIRIELSSDVLFDFDKADLLPKALPELEKVATVLKAYPKASCTIEGHTDRKGSDPYNQKLSQRRADSVKNWLVTQGVSNPMTTSGWGAQKPVAPNALPDGRDNPDGRQKNRRVEIVIKKG